MSDIYWTCANVFRHTWCFELHKQHNFFFFMSFDCSVLTAAQLCSECECIYQQLGQFREEIGVDE